MKIKKKRKQPVAASTASTQIVPSSESQTAASPVRHHLRARPSDTDDPICPARASAVQPSISAARLRRCTQAPAAAEPPPANKRNTEKQERSQNRKELGRRE